MVSGAGKNKKVDLSLTDEDVRMIMTVMMVVVVMSQLLAPMLQGTQAQTQALQAQTQAQAFVGNEDPRTVPVTNLLSWINLVYDYPYTPWVSAFVINDGPGSVEIGINFPDDRFTMNPGETRTITRTGAQERIRIVYFICRPGLNTSVRITGVY